MENLSPFVAFSAGLLSFLSPCVLPLVPVYLASLCGPEIFDARVAGSRITIFIHSLSFVVGFTIVFTMLGISAGLVGFAIGPHLAWIRYIAGGFLIVFGLFMLASQRVTWLNYEKHLTPSLGVTTGYLRSFLTGVVFCMAWTPCVGPMLGGILTIALASETVWHGAYLLAIYSLGLGLPFLIIGAAFNSIRPLLRRINRYSNWVYTISGLLLVAVGILILANRLTWLQA